MSTFPDVPTDLTVEIDLGGTWTDITSYCMRDPITIRRGRPNEATRTSPTSISGTINNRDGRFSIRNPMGAYYGLISRNTPIRGYVSRGALSLQMTGTAGDLASTPDSAALSVTGDLDVRIDVEAAEWVARDLCGKYVTTGNQRSWALQTDAHGYLTLTWSTDGTSGAGTVVQSTLPIPLLPGRQGIRVTLDVDNGASSHDVTFYTGTGGVDGSWTQLGDSVTTAGTTSIYDSTAALEVGDVTALTVINGGSQTPSSPVRGKIRAFELRDGIGGAGTVVANPDFTAQPAGTTSFTDTAASANTWTLAGDAAISNRHWLFHAELSSLPVRWDITGTDIYVPVQAGGLLRRLGQRTQPVQSTVRRGVLSEAAVKAYWPCEDGSDATSIASGIAGYPAMNFSGSPTLAGSSVFAASAPLPTLSSSTWSGQVPVYDYSAGEAQLRFLLAIPAAGMPNNSVCMRVLTTGTAARWDIIYDTGISGTLTVHTYDADGNVLNSGTYGTANLNGTLKRYSLELTQSGADIDATLQDTTVGDNFGGGAGDTITGATFSRISGIIVNPDGAIADATLGHISVHNQITSILDLTSELAGYPAETAGRRVERLCSENNIAFRGIGNLDDSAQMGVQQPATLVSLLQECADADLGILYEPADVLGIGYRTRTSLYNQTAQVVVDYSAHELAADLAPIDDDQLIANDVTVVRTNGSSARHEVTTGALSTADPPSGAGPYSTSATINVYDDGQLPDQAAWRAHLGTVDESRYPGLQFDFSNPEVVANSPLVEQLLDARPGDRLTVANPPAWLPPDTITQVVQGFTESLTNFRHTLTLTTSPESPYQVGVYDTSRRDTSGSQLSAGVTAAGFVADAATLNSSGTTSVTVSVPAGTASGHVMVARIGLIGQVAVTPPAGWTQIGTYQDAGTAVRYAAYYRVAGGSEPASYTWSWDVASFFKNSGRIATYSGVDTSAPIADFASTGTNVNGTSFVTSSVDAVGGSLLDVGVFERHPASGAATTWTDAADTERLDHGTNAGSGQDISHACYVSSALTAGALTRTLTASQTVSLVATWAIVLRPDSSTLSVSTTSGPVWTTAAGDVPFDIVCGGEQMTVTAVSGSSSPQTFTVTRSVNGVTKTHSAGDAVSLWNPAYRAL